MVLFEIVFSNPGTHIQNYIIQMLVMVGVGIDFVIEKLSKNWTRYLLGGFIVIVLWGITASSFKTYLPHFHKNYPWEDT